MSPPRRVGALLVAAGSGERLGAGQPKALVCLGGRPLVVHALERLRAGGVTDVVVAAPAAQLAAVRALAGDAVVVAGGATRSASVRAALAALPAGVDVVLVHDAARALAPASLVTRVLAALDGGAPAVVPGLASADTLKQVDDEGRVTATVDRLHVRAVQTPQGFTRAVLERAHAGEPEATDDAALVEALGVPVVVVVGDHEAAKITVARDLAIAELLLRAEPA